MGAFGGPNLSMITGYNAGNQVGTSHFNIYVHGLRPYTVIANK